MSGPGIDLVRKAAVSRYRGDFEWVDDRAALRVGSDPRHRGFSALQIRELTQVWIRGGGEIFCAVEDRPNWRGRRDYYYWVILAGIEEEFPKGLLVEMELADPDPDDPIVLLLNAHPPSFP